MDKKVNLGKPITPLLKSALIGFSKSLALENASKGITSNVICPGYINTEMVAAITRRYIERNNGNNTIKKIGESGEVADMVTYLVSEKASYVNGATFSINGGLWMD